ncbi:MAG TPA: hypothetical protein VF177_03240 [Anaerolineae bacterium]
MSINSDRALLRRFEPIIRYTRGEQFFPMDVERYVRACSLWVHRPNQLPLLLVPRGELTLSRLAEPRAHGFGAVYYLHFIEPLHLPELAAYHLQEGRTRDPENVFQAGRGRLVRVGYTSRLVDALFSLSLLARGRVPGDMAAAAALAYRRMMAEDERYCYYGRVVRQEGWVALQYWYFYPFNNWRSGFSGANDHEADWEMVTVYLYESDNGQLCPEWVAYASHDFEGDDLRRRWDDSELQKIGEHPVIYVGAGSHASYFRPGEYLTELELPFFSPLVRFVDRLQQFWQRNLWLWGQPDGASRSDVSIFRVPFVDYARGDGLSIGPGQAKTWDEPALLNPPPAWVSQYRGLWGWHANDPFSGEDAPAGPMYRREGTVRRSWYAPLGWAGLDKVPPPDERLAQIQAQLAALEREQSRLAAEIDEKSQVLRGLGVEKVAIQGQPHLKPLRDELERRVAVVSGELDHLRAQQTEKDALAQALTHYAGRIEAGERGPARSHIRRAHHPVSDVQLRLGRFAEGWAAVSTGLMVIGFVLVALFAREFLLLGLIALVSLVVIVEASFRHRLTRLIANVTIALAIVAALVLLFEFFWEIVVFVVLVAGGYIIWENIGELRG